MSSEETTYQWKKNGVVLTDETYSSIKIEVDRKWLNPKIGKLVFNDYDEYYYGWDGERWLQIAKPYWFNIARWKIKHWLKKSR